MTRFSLRKALWLSLAVLTVAFVLSPIYWMLVTSVLPSSIVLSRHPRHHLSVRLHGLHTELYGRGR